MTVCQFCGIELMDMANYCYKCERRLDYPGVKKRPRKKLKKLGTCRTCKRDINIQNNELKCHGCKTRFCLMCEEEFRILREPGEKPFCKDCFPQYQKLIEKLSGSFSLTDLLPMSVTLGALFVLVPELATVMIMASES